MKDEAMDALVDKTDIEFYGIIETLKHQMQEFSDQAALIKPVLEKRFLEKGSTDTLKRERLFDPSSRAYDEEVKQMFASTNGLAIQIRTTAKSLQEVTNETTDPGKKNVYDAIVSSVYHRFVVQLERYYKMQTEYDQKCKQRLFREAQILLPEASEGDLEQIVESGQVQALAYDQIMMNDHKHAEARTALALLQEQQRELTSLENSIHELHSLFLEVSALMRKQEDPLMKIQEQLDPVPGHVRNALEDLRSGEQDSRERRNKKIAFWGTVTGTAILGAAITIAPLFAFA